MKQEGDIFEGEYIKGKKTGKGKIVFSDGSCYEGQWKDD